MTSSAPSISDVLMLSQLAWRVGCAFNGRADAPEDFGEISREIKSLTTAVTLMAESVDDDGGLLSRADARTREGLDVILGSARLTLTNLEAFISQYQEIRRPTDATGFGTRRAWKQILVRNYKSIMWTTDGGGIQSLRNMLAMHTQSITMATRALQSRNLRRLENTVDPVATQMNSLHNPLNKSPLRLSSRLAPGEGKKSRAAAQLVVIPTRIPGDDGSRIDSQIDKMVRDLSSADLDTLHNVRQRDQSSSPPTTSPLSPPPSKPLPRPNVANVLPSVHPPPSSSLSLEHKPLPSIGKAEPQSPETVGPAADSQYLVGKGRTSNTPRLPQSPPSSYESGAGSFMHSGMRRRYGSSRSKHRSGRPFDRSSEISSASGRSQYPRVFDRNSQSSFGTRATNHDSMASSFGGSVKYLSSEAYNPHNSQTSAKDPHAIASQPRPGTSHGQSSERQFNPSSPERPGSSGAATDARYCSGSPLGPRVGLDRTPQPDDFQFRNSSRSPPPRNGGLYPTKFHAEKAEPAWQQAQPLPATLPPSGDLPAPPPYFSSEMGEDRVAFSPTDLSQISKQLVSKPAAARGKSWFSGLTILCEASGVSVDYIKPASGLAGDNVLANACGACKVYLVTKHHKFASGNVRFMTSIWVVSDDGSVRIQQKIPDGQDIAPYTVWGNNSTVIIKLPTDIEFYDGAADSQSYKAVNTPWVSYVFSKPEESLDVWSAFVEKEYASTMFQSALMGKKLLLSVKTKRTMRISDGISGAFAFAEQLCGLENLRIFQDAESGIASAMIHYSASFQEGYMTFHLNDHRNPIRVIEVDDKMVRVRGIRLTVETKPAAGTSAAKEGKSKNKHAISGAKIEFCTAMDKQLFMSTIKRLRDASMV